MDPPPFDSDDINVLSRSAYIFDYTTITGRGSPSALPRRFKPTRPSIDPTTSTSNKVESMMQNTCGMLLRINLGTGNLNRNGTEPGETRKQSEAPVPKNMPTESRLSSAHRLPLAQHSQMTPKKNQERMSPKNCPCTAHALCQCPNMHGTTLPTTRTCILVYYVKLSRRFVFVSISSNISHCPASRFWQRPQTHLAKCHTTYIPRPMTFPLPRQMNQLGNTSSLFIDRTCGTYGIETVFPFSEVGSGSDIHETNMMCSSLSL